MRWISFLSSPKNFFPFSHGQVVFRGFASTKLHQASAILCFSDAGRWKNLGVPVNIGGDNLLYPSWNRVTDIYWGGQWPPWPFRFRHHCVWSIFLINCPVQSFIIYLIYYFYILKNPASKNFVIENLTFSL